MACPPSSSCPWSWSCWSTRTWWCWPGGPLQAPLAFAAILAADLAIGFDVFIRPALRGAVDRYRTWKIYVFFVLSPLLLGAPWVEGLLLAPRYQPPAWLFGCWLVGMAATVAGGLLLAWARLTLGRFGSPKIFLQDDHQLITAGPYRWLRNPMYSSNLLMYGGVALAMGAWISLALAVAGLLPMLLERTKLEERLLEERFGDEYRDWARRTWRLVPFVW
jgi:protein-S-isoprenylcysteine O-methyltransferase Ste14